MTGQLFFAFISDPPEPSISRPSRYRQRLQRIAMQAYELGRRRGRRNPIQQPRPHSIGAAAVTPRSAVVSRRDRNELEALAHRVARLTIDRRDPERFHIEKSEIADALRWIARQA